MASIFGRAIIVPKTNKSGGALAKGDVVIVDGSNDNAVTTTTTGAYTGIVGVVVEENGIANDKTGRVQFGGHVALVTPNASVTRGHYAITHTVAKQAADGGASRITGAFGVFTTGGTTPEADLFVVPDGSGTAAAGTLTTIEEADGSPTDSAVTKLVFPNGSLGIASHVATYTPVVPTVTETFLTGNVDLTGANNFVDVVSVTINGTYLIIGTVCLQGTGAGPTALTAKLTNGTIVAQSEEFWDKEPGGSFGPVTLHAFVTTSGSETWKIQAASNVNHGTALATVGHNATTNKATVIRAIKFA